MVIETMQGNLSLEQDIGNLKFTAVKVDVTSLRTSSHRRQQVVVVVVSSVTSTRDVIRTVAQKIGMHRDDCEMLQLHAVVPKHRSLVIGNEGEIESIREIALQDGDVPLNVYKHGVSFCLRWRSEDVNQNFAGNGDLTYLEDSVDTCNLRPHPSNNNHLTSSPAAMMTFQRHQPTNGCTMPGSSTRLPVQQTSVVPSPVRTERAPGALQQQQSTGVVNYRRKASYASNDGASSSSSSTSAAAPPSNLRRWSMATAGVGECLVHYEPSVDDGGARRSRVSATDDDDRRGGTCRNRSASFGRDVYLHPSGSGGKTSSTSGGIRASADRLAVSRHHHLGGTAGLQATFRPYSNLATACSDDEDSGLKDATGGTSGGASPASDKGGVAGAGEDAADRPLVKFCSLPNVEELGKADVAAEGRLADCARPEVSCLDRPSPFVSMPCISACRRRGRTPKRFLPSLSIPEEVVEAKKKSLSMILCQKLQKVAQKDEKRVAGKPDKKTDKTSKPKKSKNNRKSSPDKRDTRKEPPPVRHDSTTSADDDCVSMTSREVAEILSTAAPMAPPSDDDDDEVADSFLDDESDLAYRLSSTMQLLRVESSTSSSNTVDGRDSSSLTDDRNRKRNRHVADVTPTNAGGRCDHRQIVDAISKHHRRVNGLTTTAAGHRGGSVGGGSDERVRDPTATGDGDGPGDGFGPLSPGRRRRLSLFALLQTHRLLSVFVERRANLIGGPSQPFHVINDVISVNDVTRRSSVGSKFTVPVVARLFKDDQTWSVTSRHGVHSGDILVEVNGSTVIGHSANDVTNLLVASPALALVVARRLPTAAVVDQTPELHL